MTHTRFLSSDELRSWSTNAEKYDWFPEMEVAETDSTYTLSIELPGCGIGDIQLAVLPRILFLRRRLQVLSSRSWWEAFQAIFGPRTLFRRFDLPALIDVNRVTAELELGVLTVVAPKQAAHKQGSTERPAGGVPDSKTVFAA